MSDSEEEPPPETLIDLSFEDRNDLLDALSRAHDHLTPDQYAALDDLFHEWKNARPEEAHALQKALKVITEFEIGSGSQDQK